MLYHGGGLGMPSKESKDALRRAAGTPEVCSVTNLQPLRVRRILPAAQPPSTNRCATAALSWSATRAAPSLRSVAPTGPGSGLHSGEAPP